MKKKNIEIKFSIIFSEGLREIRGKTYLLPELFKASQTNKNYRKDVAAFLANDIAASLLSLDWEEGRA